MIWIVMKLIISSQLLSHETCHTWYRMSSKHDPIIRVGDGEEQGQSPHAGLYTDWYKV